MSLFWKRGSSSFQVWQWSAEGLPCSFLQVAESMLEHNCFPLQLAFFQSCLSGYTTKGQHSVKPELLMWAGEQVGAWHWVQAVLTSFWANVTFFLLKVFFLNLVEFVCIFFSPLFFSSVVGLVRSFICTLIYHYKHVLFLFQYNSRKSWASTHPVPLLGYPAAPGQGQPHICRVPGGCTARNWSLFLCQEEQERGQHTVSPGYSVSSHRQRKLTGSSNPLCWYPKMTEHQCRKEKKKVIIEVTQQAAGLVPEKTIRKGSVGTNRACAC